MADDPNPALRAEITAAQAVVVPQIRGLHNLAAMASSTDLAAAFASQTASRQRRADLLQAVIDDINHLQADMQALEDHGYPHLDPITVVDSLYAELQREADDLEAAVAVFKADTTAANIAVSLGDPQPKQPAGA
jgi:hypothetical protein